jgi:UDP-2,3-diacylglucosamine pyrophosphatase LpxH
MRVKRKLELCVLSDLHLGTYGCHARDLNAYLKSIHPDVLVLNGDIIDIWNFRKRYFPKEHIKVIRSILKMAASGTKVYYITGNHDESLRRFSGFKLGNIDLRDKLVLKIGEQRAWFFHGDVFDRSIQGAKFIAKLGGWGYDLLILLNRFLNNIISSLGRERYSLSKRIKSGVKKAVSFISDFEQVAADLAIDKGYDYVVCGHIHQPQMRTVENDKGSTIYLNSGDWVESLTA